MSGSPHAISVACIGLPCEQKGSLFLLRQTQQAAKISAAQASSFKEWRIIVVVPLLVLSFLSVGSLVTTPIAHAYSCGGNHCYGIQDWYGTVNGSETTITIANLSCTGGCVNDGFIDNEMWLSDEHTKACVNNQYSECWVEVGYQNDGSGPTNHFWGDMRPIDNAVNYHPLMQASSYPTAYTLDGVGNQQFEVGLVFLYPCRYGCRYTYFSTQNSMGPNHIKIGQELAGQTGGASASRADFSNNYWQGAINGGWNLQGYGNGPGVSYDSPPYAAWVNNTPSSNDFYTHCC
jgi:hypothetical protein